MSHSKPRVMMIDDDPLLTRLVEQSCVKWTQELIVRHTTDHVVAQVAAVKPDVLLLDLHMQDGGGFDVAYTLQQHPKTSGVPIVFLTTDTGALEKIKMFEVGAVDYIQKPIKIQELKNRVLAAFHHVAWRNKVSNQVDPLTGLPSQAFFRNAIQRSVDLAKKDPDYNFAILVIDIDRFKLINDGLGRQVGDQLLCHVARCLADAIRTDTNDDRTCLDTLCRLGGDEFIVLLDGIPSAEAALAAAERFMKICSKPVVISGADLSVSCSIGIKYGDGQLIDIEVLMQDSDAAMYHAKQTGKGVCVLFNEKMRQNAGMRLQLEQDLRDALVNQEFDAVYQPFVDLETGMVCGFEALVRWEHPQRGIMSPEVFVGVAEETGLILDLGEWMLREALTRQRTWQKMYPDRRLTIGVNLSKKQISHPGLLERIDHVIQQTHINPECIKLEVTESIIMHDSDRVVPVLHELRERGFSLAMDDFGTGESSLASLHTFPIDVLKIDKAFVHNLTSTRGYTAIVNAIVTLAHNLDMLVIAEGVEDKEQLAQLQAMECDIGQGYLFAKPVHAKLATELLGRRFSVDFNPMRRSG